MPALQALKEKERKIKISGEGHMSILRTDPKTEDKGREQQEDETAMGGRR